MTIFDNREDAYENKFAHDQELRFKATVRRNKLFGLWLAGKLGFSGTKAEDYAKEVVQADLQEPGDEDVLRKVRSDIDAAQLILSEDEIREKMLYFMGIAIQQIEHDR